MARSCPTTVKPLFSVFVGALGVVFAANCQADPVAFLQFRRADRTTGFVAAPFGRIAEIGQSLGVDDYVGSCVADRRGTLALLIRQHGKSRIDLWRDAGGWRRIGQIPCPDGGASLTYDAKADRLYVVDEDARPEAWQFTHGQWKPAFTQIGEPGMKGYASAQFFPRQNLVASASSLVAATDTFGGVVSAMKVNPSRGPTLYSSNVDVSVLQAFPSRKANDLIVVDYDGHFYRTALSKGNTLSPIKKVWAGPGPLNPNPTHFSTASNSLFALTRSGKIVRIAEGKNGRFKAKPIRKTDHVAAPFCLKSDDAGKVFCLLGPHGWAIYRLRGKSLTLWKEGSAPAGSEWIDCFGVVEKGKTR